MKHNALFMSFLLLAVIQLAIPGSVVVKQEQALAQAQPFKFQMGGFDPGDPFRGNYLQLRFEQEMRDDLVEFGQNRMVYVSVTEGEDGFAKVSGLSTDEPEGGAYFKALRWYGRLRFPFNRFFVNELQAKSAEDLLRGNQAAQTYAVVRVGPGHAVLEDLVVNGKPLRQALGESTD